MTIREQIVAAMVVALNAGSPPVTFVRNRIDAPTPDQLPVSTVYQVAEKVTHMGGDREQPGSARRGPAVHRFVDVAVDHIASAETGADAAADPQLAWAEAKLIGAGTLGGLSTHAPDLMETKFSYEQGDEVFCRATQTYRVWFQTKTDDPESVN